MLHKATDAIFGLHTVGLLQKKAQALMVMMMKLIVVQKVIRQQVMKKRIVEKMGYQYQLHTVMELMSSGIGYRRATNNKHIVFTVPADGPQLR